MPSVDKRVVEMRFDNKDFETGVNESISSLDKLKQTLKMKDAVKDFDEIGNAADHCTIKIQKFGAFTEQIIRNVANEVYGLKNKFVGLVKSMSVDQITAGMSKYEQKTASVQTILNATGESMDEVNRQLERLMRYSDETSFGFTDMTSALQTMTASGGDLETLIPMLMGIGNATAFAGKSAREFSSVMYNLNQAYSLGYLGTQDWKSVNLMGVGSKQLKQALLDSARALGTGDYAFDEFQTALTKKAFTTEVMEDAFGKFARATLEAEKLVEEGVFEEFSKAYDYIAPMYKNTGDEYDELAYSAARAAQEAKTFNEAIEATKDAVSSGWMTTFEQIFGNYTEAKDLWTWLANELWDVFASGSEDRNKILQEWHNTEVGGYETLWAAIKNFWYGLRAIGGRIKEVWNQIFPSITSDKLVSLTNRIYDWSVRFKGFFEPVGEIIEEVQEVVEDSGLEEAVDTISAMVRTLQDLDILVDRVWNGEYGVGFDRFERLAEEGYVWEVVQNAVNETAGCLYRFEVSEEDLANATEYLNGEFEDTGYFVVEAGEAIDDLSQSAETSRHWVLNLRDVVMGLKSGFDLLVEAGKAVFKYIAVPIWNGLVTVFKRVLSVIAPFSRAFSDFVEKVKASDTIGRNLERIMVWLDLVWERAKEQENVKKLLDYLDRFKGLISGVKASALEKVQTFFDKITKLNIKLPKLSDASQWINDVAGWFDRLIEKFQDVEDIWPRIKEFFSGLDFSNVQTFAQSVASGIGTFFKTLFTDEELRETGSSWLTQIIEGIKEKAKEIDWGELLSSILKGLVGYEALRFISSLSAFFGGVGDVADNFATRISLLFKSITKAVNAAVLVEIAVAIGILAGAMLLLSKIPADRLPQIAVDISVVILALAVLAKVIGSMKMFNNGGIGPRIKVNVFSKFATILFGFGIVLAALAVAIKVLSKIPKNDLWRAIGAIGAIMGIFAVLALAIKAISQIGRKSPDTLLNGDHFGSDMLKIAGAFAIMAFALDLMLPTIAALAGLSTLNDIGLRSGILMIAGILAAFTLVVLATKNTKPKTILSVGAMFVLFAVALKLLLPVFAVLEGLAAMNLKAYWSVMGAIAGLLVLFAAAIGILGSLKNNAAKKGSIAIVALGVAIVAIAGAMKMMKGIKWADIQTGVLVLAGIVVVMVALGALVAHFGVIAIGIVAIGVALLLFGAGIALVSAGALAFAKAIDIMSRSTSDAKKAGRNLAGGVVGFFEELNNNLGPILAVITKIVGAVLAVLILKKADIVNTGAGIVTAFGNKIKTQIDTKKGVVFGALAIFIAEILDYLGLKTDVIIDTLIKGVALILNGLASAIVTNAGVIYESVMNLVDALSYLAGYVLNQIKKPLLQILETGLYLPPGSLSENKHLTSSIEHNLDEWGQRVQQSAETMGYVARKGISQNIEELTTSSASMLENATGQLTSAWGSFGQNVGDAESKAIEDLPGMKRGNGTVGTMRRSDYAELYPNLTDKEKLWKYFDSSSTIQGLSEVLTSDLVGDLDMETLGTLIPEGLADGISQSTGVVIPSLEELFNLIKEYATSKDGIDSHSPSKVSEGWGKFIDEGLAVGIRTNIGIILSAIREVSRLMQIRAMSIGQNFVLGLNGGMKAYSYLIEAQVRQLATTVYDTFAKELEIKSPSKRGEELGMYFDLGIAGGVDENAGLVTDTVAGMSEETLAAFNAVIARIQDAINGEWDVSPVIRPVLDLSEIQNGQGRIASILGTNARYGFSPDLSYSRMQANNVQASMNTYTGRDILMAETMASMQTQIGELTAQNQTMMMLLREYMPYIPQVANMKMVTDRGTLVGELAPLMNEKLGIIAAKNRKR